MRTFLRKIFIEDGILATFIFTPMHANNGLHYFVQFKTKSSFSIGFKMEMIKGRWRIVPQADLHTWLYEKEEILEGYILIPLTFQQHSHLLTQ